MPLTIPGAIKDRSREKYKELCSMVENPVGYGDYDREEFMDLLKDQVLFLKAEIYDAESNTDVAQKRFSGYMNNLLVKSAEGRYSDIFRLLYDVVEKKDKIRFDISEDAHWYSPTYYTDKLEKSIVSFYEMWIFCAGSEAAGSLVRRDILNVLSECRVHLKKSGKTMKRLQEIFWEMDTGACEDCTELLEMRCREMTEVLELMQKDRKEQFLSMDLYKWQGVILGGFPIERTSVLFRCVRPSEIRPCPDRFNLRLIRENRPDILKEAVKWGYITSVNALPLYDAAAEQKLCGEKTLMFLIRVYRQTAGGNYGVDLKDNMKKEGEK